MCLVSLRLEGEFRDDGRSSFATAIFDVVDWLDLNEPGFHFILIPFYIYF